MADLKSAFNVRSVLSLAIYNFADDNPLPYVNAKRHVLSAFFTVVFAFFTAEYVLAELGRKLPNLSYTIQLVNDSLTMVVVVYCTIMLRQMLGTDDGFSWLKYGVFFLVYNIAFVRGKINYGTSRI